jgi:hypothetical protein
MSDSMEAVAICVADGDNPCIRKTRIEEYEALFAITVFQTRLITEPGSEIGQGVRAINLVGHRLNRSIDCFCVQIDPQSSSLTDHTGDRRFHVLVLKCEKDLASAVIDGATLELQFGDHLVLNPGMKYHFINSSLSIPLKLRMLSKIPI